MSSAGLFRMLALGETWLGDGAYLAQGLLGETVTRLEGGVGGGRLELFVSRTFLERFNSIAPLELPAGVVGFLCCLEFEAEKGDLTTSLGARMVCLSLLSSSSFSSLITVFSLSQSRLLILASFSFIPSLDTTSPCPD